MLHKENDKIDFNQTPVLPTLSHHLSKTVSNMNLTRMKLLTVCVGSLRSEIIKKDLVEKLLDLFTSSNPTVCASSARAVSYLVAYGKTGTSCRPVFT